MPATYPPREGCTALIDSVLATEGRIDVLCNNAGINRRGPLLSITPEDWRLSFAVNIDAMFHLCQAALPQMIAQGGGAIVNTASQWGLYPAPNHIAYNVTKAAVASFTQNLARDYAPQKIHDDPRLLEAAPFAATIKDAIFSVDPANPTRDPVPYTGVQFVAIPEFQGIGNFVGQQVAAALAGDMTVEEALAASQDYAVREMTKAGYIK